MEKLMKAIVLLSLQSSKVFIVHLSNSLTTDSKLYIYFFSEAGNWSLKHSKVLNDFFFPCFY